MAILRVASSLLVACLLAAVVSAQPGGGAGEGSRAPPDIRALDLAIDEARLEDDSSLLERLTSLKADHMKQMGDIMSKQSSIEAMRQIDELSSQLAGSSGDERKELHNKLHAAIQVIEDDKFVSMGLTADDKDLHRALLREKHAIVIQLVDDDELHELNEEERQELMGRFEAVEMKMVAHMKDYFLSKAKQDL